MTAAVAAELVFVGHKAKDGAPYRVTVGPKHQRVLRALATAKPRGKAPHHGLTDAELTFATGVHMAAARRCELRDIGCVQKAGIRNGSMTWVLTEAGRQLHQTIESKENAA